MMCPTISRMHFKYQERFILIPLIILMRDTLFVGICISGQFGTLFLWYFLKIKKQNCQNKFYNTAKLIDTSIIRVVDWALYQSESSLISLSIVSTFNNLTWCKLLYTQSISSTFLFEKSVLFPSYIITILKEENLLKLRLFYVFTII